VNLRGALANPDLGVILLHRLVQGEEPTVAATTLKASKPARKAFQKSIELAKKKDFDKAMDSLREAVKLDPNFAFAWSELGKLQAAHNHVAESRQSFEAAAKSEPRWPEPLLELALLDLRTGAWKELADVTGQVLRLNSFDYPGCFFYNALANYNLGRLPMAEKSARSAQKLDTRRQFPQTAHLLGDILALNRQYAEAADQFRRYLALAPEAADAPGVRKRLEDVEKLAAGAPPTPR
jgi:tetratricopeptide (TPR) repeat protein